MMIWTPKSAKATNHTAIIKALKYTLFAQLDQYIYGNNAFQINMLVIDVMKNKLVFLSFFLKGVVLQHLAYKLTR